MARKEWTSINVEPNVKEKLKEKTIGDESVNSFLKREFVSDKQTKYGRGEQ